MAKCTAPATTRLDRSVAIKILPAHLSADPASKLRFEREAKTLSALNHPNICSLFDVGSQNGTDFLVMECIEGESLADRIKGPVPTEQVLKIGAEIADALDEAHRLGVVHGDLKPRNIMLTSHRFSHWLLFRIGLPMKMDQLGDP